MSEGVQDTRAYHESYATRVRLITVHVDPQPVGSVARPSMTAAGMHSKIWYGYPHHSTPNVACKSLGDSHPFLSFAVPVDTQPVGSSARPSLTVAGLHSQLMRRPTTWSVG